MALSRRCSHEEEYRDLARLLAMRPDTFLRVDERTHTRDVLMVGGPGRIHAHWTRHHRWRVGTSFGDLQNDIVNEPTKVRARIEALFDPDDQSKQTYRGRARALDVLMAHFRQHYNVATTFPPCHARFLVDRYLPREGQALVFDPCAGWGGRLVGALTVPRASDVSYVGVDPNALNQDAYHRLMTSVAHARQQLPGQRNAHVSVAAFEDWINSSAAIPLMQKADVVLTSPPYHGQERYSASRDQSANRYPDYPAWRERFFTVLIDGAHRLLRPGGVFVLNVADVQGAPLERDAIAIAREIGFVPDGYFKLAMNITPGTKSCAPRHWVKVDGRRWKFEPVFTWRKRSEL
jgi:hypothetical protein